MSCSEISTIDTEHRECSNRLGLWSELSICFEFLSVYIRGWWAGTTLDLYFSRCFVAQPDVGSIMSLWWTARKDQPKVRVGLPAVFWGWIQKWWTFLAHPGPKIFRFHSEGEWTEGSSQPPVHPNFRLCLELSLREHVFFI